MTGIIGGEIVLLGMIALPQMLRLGYNKNIAIGTICAGGSLGTMIPPSVVLIIYGLTANVPIGDLFLATIAPAFVLAGLYLFYILVRCNLNPKLGPPAPPEERSMPVREKLALFKDLVLPAERRRLGAGKHLRRHRLGQRGRGHGGRRHRCRRPRAPGAVLEGGARLDPADDEHLRHAAVADLRGHRADRRVQPPRRDALRPLRGDRPSTWTRCSSSPS